MMYFVRAAGGLFLFLAAVTCYTLRSFHPEQPMHHELNQAAGILLVALIVWIVASSLIIGDGDDDD